MRQNEKFHCLNCKHYSETCIIKQIEELYYEYNRTTDQWEDCHGDGGVLSQQFLCEECNAEITVEEN
jgi:hypothetical protein